MLYVAYALEREHYDYGSLPWADEIADEFAVPGGISYAFMNLSKLSNESENWQRDNVLIKSFLDMDSKELLARELQILNPDLIITMNLVGDYGDYLGKLRHLENFGSEGQVCLHTLETSLDTYKLVDSYHFSCIGKRNKEDLFDPIIDACRTALQIK